MGTGDQFTVSEKDLMLRSIEDLKSEVKNLTQIVQNNVLKQKSDDNIKEIVNRVMKDNTKTVEDIVSEFKRIHNKEKEESLAQLKANFSIFGEQLKSPLRSTTSSYLANIAESKSQRNRYEMQALKKSSDSVENLLSSGLAHLSKIVAPKFTQKQTSRDAGQDNPNFKSYDDVIKKLTEAKNEGNLEVKLAKVLASYSSKLNLDKEKAKELNTIIDRLMGSSKGNNENVNKTNKEKTQEIIDLAKQKEQKYYDEQNDSKKEMLADWEAKKSIFNEKYLGKNVLRSLASDYLGGLAKSKPIRNRYEMQANEKGSEKVESMMKYGINYGSKLFSKWYPKKEEVKEDQGEENPNFGKPRGKSKASSGRKSTIKDAFAPPSEKIEGINSLSIDEKLRVQNETVTDVENSLDDLNVYVKHHLVDDIIDGIEELLGKDQGEETSGVQESAGGAGEGEGEEEGSGFGMGNMMKNFRKARLGARKFGRFIKGGAGKLMGAGRAALSFARAPIGGIGGTALGAAAGLALAGATAYTVYETGKTVAAINEGKENVRESTKGTSQEAIKRGEEKYTKDNQEVKNNAERYIKAGLTKDESLSTSLAERNNSRLLGSIATMGGIFSAAKQSTDFRTSDKEMESLQSGETLADTIRSGLQNINSRLQDPNSVKNMSSQEVNSLANHAKVTAKQINDLKKSWDESKKLGKGWMDSQWLKDEDLVSNGDKVINSLVESSKDIDKAFDEWSKQLASGADQRSKNKDKKDQKSAKEQLKSNQPSSTPPAEASGDAFDRMDKALDTGKPIEPPKGYRETTPEENKKAQDKLKDNISAIDKQTQPVTIKIGDEIKGTMVDQNKDIMKKLDAVASKVDEISKKKTPAPPYMYDFPPDSGFSNIGSISKGV